MANTYIKSDGTVVKYKYKHHKMQPYQSSLVKDMKYFSIPRDIHKGFFLFILEYFYAMNQGDKKQAFNDTLKYFNLKDLPLKSKFK